MFHFLSPIFKIVFELTYHNEPALSFVQVNNQTEVPCESDGLCDAYKQCLEFTQLCGVLILA